MFRWILLLLNFISLLVLQDARGQATPYLTDLYLQSDIKIERDSVGDEGASILRSVAQSLFHEEYQIADSLLRVCEHNFRDDEKVHRLRSRWLFEMGRFDEALQEIRHLSQNPDYSNSVEILDQLDLASCYVGLADYEQALAVYQKLEMHWTYPPDHLLTLRLKEQKALLHTLADDVEIAFNTFTDLDTLWQETDHVWYLYFKTHQGVNLTRLGKYDLAESAFLEVISNPGLPDLRVEADAASNLAQLYNLIGDYTSAERFFLQAEHYYQSKNLLHELSTISNNLGLLYDAMDSLDLAKNLYSQALNYYQKLGDTNSINYAIILQNLAGLLDYQEDYSQAEPLYLESLDIIREELGQENDLYTTTLSNIGILYENMEVPKKSEPYYREGLSIRKNTLGSEHPKYLELLYNLAGLYSHINPEAAVPLYQEANRKQLELMKYYYSTFDQETSIYFYEHMELEFERFYSLATDRDMSADLAIDMLNFSMATKGLALEYHRMDRDYVHSDLETDEVYRQWEIFRDSLSSSILKSSIELKSAGVNLEDLKFQTKLLEKEWSRSAASPIFGALDFDQLKSILQPDEVFIDFVSFERFKSGDWTGVTEYYAIIVDKNSFTPVIVRLCAEEVLDNLFQSNIHPTNDPQLNRALFNVVWKPVQPYVSKFKQIYICPTRLLHKVPFEGFFDGNNYLISKYNFHYLSNAKNINRSLGEVNYDESILAIGALDYGSDEGSVFFPSLPGTAAEMAYLSKIAESARSDIEILTGLEGSELKIRQKLNTESPAILHVASHGFSFDRNTDERYADLNLRNKLWTADNPLLRSGIVLSDVNNYWMTKSGLETANDGVLTAFEVSTLPLNETELVVLSACETGLGEVHSVEGVFGLQRAFRMCGVDHVIYTLWVIPDTESSLLLRSFYKYYFKGHDASSALQRAKKRLSRKHPPRYWAGYILMQ